MELKTLVLEENKPYPNSRLPVLLYAGACGGLRPDFVSRFKQHGWTGVWVNGVYGFHHFHAQAHEALGCLSGWARVLLGGPGGIECTLEAGDAVLLPAGTGHKLLEASPDFSIAGAYPPGQSPDLQRGKQEDYTWCKARCLEVPLPALDPVSGHPFTPDSGWALP